VSHTASSKSYLLNKFLNLTRFLLCFSLHSVFLLMMEKGDRKWGTEVKFNISS
jgi:hypothetical protein